jgi:hypothetical protein
MLTRMPAKIAQLRNSGEKDIRFREQVGLLEDHPFAVEAYLKAGIVSVLSDYPVYRWVVERGARSGSQRLPDIDGYFAQCPRQHRCRRGLHGAGPPT